MDLLHEAAFPPGMLFEHGTLFEPDMPFAPDDSRDFYDAVTSGDETLVEEMLRNNNVSDEAKAYAVHLAVREENKRIIEMLSTAEANLDFFARSDCDGYERTPLMYACSFIDDLEIHKLLLDNGASPHIFDRRGWTALHASVYSRDNTASTSLLLQYDVDVNAQLMNTSLYGTEAGVTPLQCAISAPKPRLQQIKLLLENGANVNGWSSSKGTALHCAVHAKAEEAMDLLLQTKGVDCNIKDSDGHTVLCAIVTDMCLSNSMSHDGYVQQYADMVEKVLRAGASLDEESDFVRYCVHGLQLKKKALAFAFAMGQHDRLGGGSLIRILNPDIMKGILWQLLSEQLSSE